MTAPRRRRWLAAWLGLAAGLSAAGTVIEDKNIWAHVAVTGPLLDRRPAESPWRFSFDSPNRFADDAHRQAQSVWRAALGYTLSAHWSAWAGYGYTWTGVPYTRTPYGEHRTFQQLTWSDRVGAFSLGYRARLEERRPATGSDTGLRLRQQFRVSHPLPPLRPLSWIFWEEHFLNLNATDYGARRGLDQNRVFAGLGWKWTDVTRTEFGYLHHFSHRIGQPNRVNHVVAISLVLTLP